MSEQDEQRPLTRRERRLREMAETGALDLSEATGATEPPATPEPASAPSADEGEIEISPFHEDGTPRSRREMRQLREQALAARAAQVEAAEEPVAEEPAEPELEPVAEPATEVEEPAAEPEEPAAEEPAVEEEAAEPVVEEPAAEVEEPAAEESEAPAEEPAAEVEEPATEAEAEEPVAEPVVEAAEESAAAAEEPAAEEPVAEDPAAEEPAAEEPEATPEPEPDFDTLIAPPTEPFTVAELREAEQTAADADEAAEDAVLEELRADEPSADEPSAEAAADAPAKPKRRFWKRNKDAADEEQAIAEPATEEQAAEAEEAEPVAETPAEPAPTAVIPAVPESVAEEAGPADAPAVEEPEAPAEAPAEEPGQPAESPEQKTSYSFPDIAPPEEWRSVFDDPSARVVPDQGGKTGDGDFDELISRAVAQEGSTGGTGGAALILPSMPEDTGGLTGPLGGTGELYVTGSLKLPKSLGETGGHAALHDSIEMDPITGVESDEAQTTGQGPAPVSARHAVSARAVSGMPVVAKPAKERSKLPLVLSLTGGGLLIAVIALGAWGASNGLFG